MAQRFVRFGGLLVILLLIAGLWWWRQNSQLPQSVQPPASRSAQPTHNSADGNFLPVSLAPAINLPTILTGSFVIPAGANMGQIITVTTTGDIIPARGVDMQIRTNGPDYPLAGPGIQSLLSGSDVTIINLESPLIANCPVTKSGFTFCGQPQFASAMARSGIDVATLENNHIGNYGQSGVSETIQYLTAAGIQHATDSHLAIKMVKGIKIGVLAFNGVGGRFYPNSIKTQIAVARPEVDLLFVAYHWGKEYESLPMPDPAIAPDDPQYIGRMAIDAGADLVIGNHPHWVQGVEIYKGKIISYALGNFIFDQSWSTPTMQGLVGTYTFYGTKLIGAVYTPIHIDNQAQPKVVDGVEAKQIMDQFAQSSRQLNAR